MAMASSASSASARPASAAPGGAAQPAPGADNDFWAGGSQLVESPQEVDSQALSNLGSKRTLVRQGTDNEVNGTQSGLEGANMVECVFDCGPPRHISLCTNTGTHANPRWMCTPCNGARKALEHACRKSGQMPELKQLRLQDPEMYTAKIRACRVKSATDPPDALGLRDNRQRAAAFSTFLSTQLSQTAEIQGKAKRQWMTQNEFIAFLKYKKGEEGLDNPEDKQRAWKAALDNPDVLRKGSGDSQIIFVDKGTTWAAIRSRAMTTSVNRLTNLESQKEVEDAMAQVAQTGVTAGAFSGGAFKGIGDMFRPEVAAASSSSSGPDSGQLALAAAASAPPPASVVVPDFVFAPFGTSFGGHPDGVGAIQWDPESSSKKGALGTSTNPKKGGKSTLSEL